MTTSPSPQRTSHTEAYRILYEQMTKRGQEAADKVAEIVQGKSGTTLDAYHASTAISEEDKFKLYRECLVAILRPDELAKAAALKGKSAQDLFTEMCELLKKGGREAHMRITAHLRATTGKTLALAVYHNDSGVPDAQKVALYAECIVALKSKDYSKLQGEVGVGDRRVELESKTEVEGLAPELESEPDPVASDRPDAEAVVNAEELDEEALLKRQLEIIRKRKAEQAKRPAFDESAVRKLTEEIVQSRLSGLPALDEKAVKDIVTHMMGNGGFPSARVESIVNDRLKAFAPSMDIDSKVDSLLSLKLADFLKIGPAALATSTKPTTIESGELASYIPKPDPTYVVGKEMRDFLKHVHNLSCKAPENVMVVGPHGCGKTTLAEIFAAEFGMPILIMDCANIREPRDWFGYKYTDSGSVKWHRSQFDRCLSAGNHVIVLDELPRTTDQIRNTLFPLLDYRRRTYLEERGDYITVGPGTVIFVTANEGMAYTGCSTLDLALDDRLTRRVEVNYLSVADETNVLVQRTGVDKEAACKLAELAEEIRAKAIGLGAVLTKTISTRRLIEAAEDYKTLGVSGLTYSITNNFSAEGGDQSERAKILLMLQGKFGAA